MHGLGGDRSVWNGILPSLAPEFRLIAADLRGHGATEAPAGSTFTFPEMEDDLLRLLDAEGIQRCHLVGLSAGAFLGLRFALDRPDRVAGLVTIGGAAHCDNHTRAIGDRWAETLQKEGRDALVLRLLKDLYYPDWVEAHLDDIERIRKALSKEGVSGTARWGAAVRTFDERSRFGRLSVPLLVIHGYDDQVVDVAHARLLRQAVLGTELKLLAQTGHLVPIERPQETVEAIRTFLRKVEATRPAS